MSKIENFSVDIVKKLSYLYRNNLELTIDIKEYIEKNYSEFVNEFVTSESFRTDRKSFIYYFDKLKLYKSFECINKLLHVILRNNLEKEMLEITNKITYQMFLQILRYNLDMESRLKIILSLFPKKYIENENTLEVLSHSCLTFKRMGLFTNMLDNEKKTFIDNNFSFIKNISTEELKNYLKRYEDEDFVYEISKFINKECLNNIYFCNHLLSFKKTFNEFVPFEMKKKLLDKIVKRYSANIFDYFEKDLEKLTIAELIFIFDNVSTSKANEYLAKLYSLKHIIFSDKETIIELIKKGYSLSNFIDVDFFSKEELNTIKKYLDIENINNKKVKVHPKITCLYKFDYEKDEILPNGFKRVNFVGKKQEHKLDKLLFEFLINSSDIELLYDNYYEQYKNLMVKKYGEGKFSQIDTIYHFMKFVLAEKKVKDEIIMPNLEKIYNKLNLTNLQIEHIRNFICIIEPQYYERISSFLIRQRNVALSKYNAIVRMHLNGENINKALELIGLNSDELISEIIKMRNLYKEEKKTLIDLLRKEKYILTVGDILGLLQEMEENDYTIDEVLRLNGINKKYFYSIYKELIYTNPEIHKKIKEILLNNKKRGFKKYIRLVYYITTLDFNDKDEFKNMFPDVDLDKMIENMERIEKNNLVTKLKEVKLKINSKQKQIN